MALSGLVQCTQNVSGFVDAPLKSTILRRPRPRQAMNPGRSGSIFTSQAFAAAKAVPDCASAAFGILQTSDVPEYHSLSKHFWLTSWRPRLQQGAGSTPRNIQRSQQPIQGDGFGTHAWCQVPGMSTPAGTFMLR